MGSPLKPLYEPLTLSLLLLNVLSVSDINEYGPNC